MIILIGLSLFFFSILVRSFARLLQKDFGIDTWYYLLYAEGFRKRRKLPVVIPYYLLDEDNQYYPPGFPILLSFFSAGFLKKWHWLINPTIDSLQALLLYLFTYSISLDIKVSVFSALLYTSSPILITQSSNLNSRMFASLLLTCIVLSMNAFAQNAVPGYLFLSLLFGFVLSFSHKMTMQQLVFLVIGFTILTQNFLFCLIFALIIGVNFLIGRRFYLGLLRSHVQIIKFWSKNLPFLGLHSVYDSPLYSSRKKSSDAQCVKGLQGSRFLYSLEKIKIAGVFLLAMGLFFSKRYIHSYTLDIMFYWILINYFTVFSTSYLPGFKNIGEGHKYLSYGIFPLSLFLSYFCFIIISPPYSYVTLLIILAMNMIVSIYIIKVQAKNSLAQIDKALFYLFETIKNLSEARIMCLPFSKAEAVAYFTRKFVLFGGHSLGWDKLDDFWPIMKKPVEYFVDMYGISHIFIDSRYVNITDLNLKVKYRLMATQGTYILLEIIKHDS